MKDNRGGTRPHSGKKTELYGQPTRRVQVSLDAHTLELLAVLGDGNVSKGVRVAARVAYEKQRHAAYDK